MFDDLGDLLPPALAAQRLGVTERTLADMRRRGDGPCAVKLTRKTYRYPSASLERWLTERRSA